MTDRSGQPDVPRWASLTGEEKRQRVLSIAGELFAREGVDFPMPELARAVGVGVGSLYRQVGTKEDVLAELVIHRLRAFHVKFEAARDPEDPLGALLGVVRDTLAETMQDRVAKISFELHLPREEVREAREAAAGALALLVEDAKAAGALRPDATVVDLRILFRLAREAERITPGGGQRVAELMVAGLRCQEQRQGAERFTFPVPDDLGLDRAPTAI